MSRLVSPRVTDDPANRNPVLVDYSAASIDLQVAESSKVLLVPWINTIVLYIHTYRVTPVVQEKYFL